MKHSYSLWDRARIAWLLFRKPHFGLPAIKLARAMTFGEDEVTNITTYIDGRKHTYRFKLILVSVERTGQ